MGKIMMLKAGCSAMHKSGDVGKWTFDDMIFVSDHSKSEYIGSFCEGIGYINVIFKKEDVRPLTKKEIDDLNKTCATINGQFVHNNKYDYDGNFIR